MRHSAQSPMKTTVTQLRKTIESILYAHPIYGARHRAADLARELNSCAWGRVIDLSLSWERAWGVNASLHVRVGRENGMKGAHGGPVPYTYFRTSCDIGWSSTGRGVNGATAAVALYRQVIDLAALIEGATDGHEEEVEAKPVPIPFSEEGVK